MATKNVRIEGLRGIAITLVIIYHFFFRYQQLYIKSYHGSKIVSTLGIFGVAIFLCITGYYIYNPAKRIAGLKFVKKDCYEYGMLIL